MCSCGSKRKETEMTTQSNTPSGDTPCSASSVPLHVYDWLDQPAKDEDERQAKEWLNKFALPPASKYFSNAHDWLAAHALTVEWRGQRYWVSVLNSSPRRWRVGGTFVRRLPVPRHAARRRSEPVSTRRLVRRWHCEAAA